MNYCQELYQKLKEWESALKELERLIIDYIKNPSKNLEEQIKKQKEEVEQKKKEYISLLEESFPEVEVLTTTGELKKVRIFGEEAKALQNIENQIQKNVPNLKPIVEVENGHVVKLSFWNFNLPHDILYPALEANIKWFTRLTFFDCSYNQLTPLPELPESLKVLDCHNNHLISFLKLPENLEGLYCYSNNFTSLLKLPKNLKVFDCSYNKLTSLPELPDGLIEFNCAWNKLKFLPELTDTLTKIDCRGNPLTEEAKEQLRKFKENHPHCQVMYFD